MKAAVSIPDELFLEADNLARDLKTSRSELYSRALADFLARHAPDRVTCAIDAALLDLPEEVSEQEFSRRASRRILENTPW